MELPVREAQPEDETCGDHFQIAETAQVIEERFLEKKNEQEKFDMI